MSSLVLYHLLFLLPPSLPPFLLSLLQCITSRHINISSPLPSNALPSLTAFNNPFLSFFSFCRRCSRFPLNLTLSCYPCFLLKCPLSSLLSFFSINVIILIKGLLSSPLLSSPVTSCAVVFQGSGCPWCDHERDGLKLCSSKPVSEQVVCACVRILKSTGLRYWFNITQPENHS